ncbi:hypothetical protein [Sporisorium scitamineum]|uniref:Uncharacterized protein n=1 Tax=Sporisorium scitamineum TaxID=49012 RepID=A0A0F7S4B1_9BASI|nr:hypothetical protein [Sporisorium scitamineum]
MAMPTSAEQFLPRLIAIFYAVFHPTEGPKVIYQTQSTKGVGVLGGEPLFDFSALSEYLIPKAPLCGRLVTSIARGTVGVRQRQHERPSRAPSVVPGRSASARSGGSSRASSVKPSAPQDADAAGKPQLEQRTYKIMGFPTLIEDATKYQRNNFIFNLCFVFEGQSDVRAYEPVVRKCGRVLRGLEESQSFLSSPKSLPRMNEVIEQLFEDLSSYSESFVALPEAPHTSYLKSSSKPNSPEGQNLVSSPIGPDYYISLGASFASLRGEHHRNMINERLKQKQMQQASNGGGGLRSRSASGSGSPHLDTGKILTPLTTIRNDALPMVRSNSASGTSGPGSEGPISPSSALSPTASNGRRPNMARSSTIVGLTDDAGQGAFPSEESRDNAMGIVTSRRQSELSRELSAAESLGNVLTNVDSNAYDSVNTASGTRRSSRGSTVGAHGAEHEGNSLEHLAESIVSLRTIDAALFDSVNALRAERADKRTALVEKRDPPHGLGRTVRDAINLKLFPVYPNPTPINDWDVPVALLDLVSRVDGNWDLTMRRILPFIDGVNHIKRIAQLADADLGLTRACLEHLMYYGCIVVVDIFQYFNMYTLRPAIATMADDEAMGRECAGYITRPGYSPPSYPEILRLYSLLRAGTTLHDWIEDNDIDAKGIDVRRFVSFGVLQGFLRRVHRYPIYLGSRTAEDGFPAFDTSVVNTVRNSPVVSSPVVKTNDSQFQRSEAQDSFRRDQSGSREPRDRRPRELSGMSGAYSAFQRIGRDGSVESPGVGQRNPLRERASEARLSNIVLAGAGGSASAFNLGDSFRTASGGGSSQFGTSPTKRHARMRQRGNQRFPTTTAVDVAAVAFQAERPASAAGSGAAARSPRKRASAIGLSTTIPSTAAPGGSTAAGGGSGIAGAGGSHAHPRSSTAAIPAELIDMLDGLHSDDEICVAFSISWPELEKMLIQIGRSPHTRTEQVDTDEDDIASTQRSDWRRWPGGSMFGTTATGGGGSSGWSKPRMSEFSGAGGGGAGRSQFSGVASSGHPSSRTQGGESSGFGVVWGNDPDESGWGAVVDREAIEAGDLGRVRILYQ